MRRRFTDLDPRWRVRLNGSVISSPIEADEESGMVLCYGRDFSRRDDAGEPLPYRDGSGRVRPLAAYGDVDIFFVHPTPPEVQ